MTFARSSWSRTAVRSSTRWAAISTWRSPSTVSPSFARTPWLANEPATGPTGSPSSTSPTAAAESAWIHGLTEGATLHISPPRSHFELVHGQAEYLLVAGGIGVTPLVGMAQALAAANADVRFLYAARTAAHHVFAEELRASLGDRLHLFASDAGERIDLDAEIARLHAQGELYLCGPPSLRDAAAHAWRAADRPARRLRFETFANSGSAPAQPFVARVRDHDDREVVVPANRTLLSALHGAGIDVMADCLRGECGLCAVTVIDHDAELDHRDVFLSDAERLQDATLCACVSRAVGGTVTIDTGFRSPGAA